MKKKVIRLTEHDLRSVVKNTLIEILSYDKEPITEMAKLNVKDGGQSEFPSNAYRVWVQGDNSPNKPPHMHIRDKQEGYEIKVLIENGQLFGINNFGKRNRTDSFSDVLGKVATWFKKPTLMPGRSGTNQEAAFDEWEACNAD